MLLKSGGGSNNPNDTINTQSTDSFNTDELIDLNQTFVEKMSSNTSNFEAVVRILPTCTRDKRNH